MSSTPTHHKTEHHTGASGFGSGFLLGLLVGAAMVFFLGTKKGKQILKSISEEGWEGFSELEELLTDEDAEFEEATPTKTKKTDEVYEEVHVSNGHAGSTVHHRSRLTPKPRRFFRKVSR